MGSFPGVITALLDAVRLQKTGELNVSCPDGERQILFENGVPVFGHSKADSDRLPEILIKKGRMTSEQFIEVEANMDMSKSIGKNLVDMGIISQGELVEGAKSQFFQIFSMVLNFPESECKWEDREKVGEVKLPLDLPRDFYKAMMDVQQKEWVSAQFSTSLNNVYKLGKGASLTKQLEFNSKLIPVLELIDGERDIRQIMMETSELDEFTILKLIMGLWAWGDLEEKELSEMAPEIQEELSEAVSSSNSVEMSTKIQETVEISHVQETTELSASEMGLSKEENEPLAHDDDRHDFEEEDDSVDLSVSFETSSVDRETQEDGPGDMEDMYADESDDEGVDSSGGESELPFYKRKIFLFNMAALVMVLIALALWSRMGSKASGSSMEETGEPISQEKLFEELETNSGAPGEETAQEPAMSSPDSIPSESTKSKEVETPNVEDDPGKQVVPEKADSEIPQHKTVRGDDKVQDNVSVLEKNSKSQNQKTPAKEKDLPDEPATDPQRFESPIVTGPLGPSTTYQKGKDDSSGYQYQPPLVETKKTQSNVTTSETKPSPSKLMDLPDKLQAKSPSSKTTDTPIGLVKEGKYLGAAQIWHGQLQEKAGLFTIVLELDCKEETLKNGFKASMGADTLFILPEKHNDQMCYLVCWGQYDSSDEAKKQIIGLPDYFKYGAKPSVRRIGDLL